MFLRASSFIVLIVALMMSGNGCSGRPHRRQRQHQHQHQHQNERHTVANGNDVTDPEKYPFFARLDFDGKQACGGALIHPEFVLSAAHCFDYPDETVTVFFTTLEFDDYDPTKQAVVKKIIQHPNWNENDRITRNDVALIQVEPVNFVDPIALNTDANLLSAGDTVTVMGFGLEETQDHADTLQETDLFITSDEQCHVENKETGGIDKPSMICALDAANNQDSCQGDSGGPLIHTITVNATDNLFNSTNGSATLDQHILVGVVSSGDGECGQNKAAAVYSEVSHFYDFIQYTICQNAVNPPTAEDCNITFVPDSAGVMHNMISVKIAALSLFLSFAVFL